MNNLLKQLLLGGSATALVAGASFSAALAQENNSGALDIETVNSSASRIDLKGFEAPTPVTVIGVDTLNRDAKVNIGDEIRELPQIRGGASITTGSSSGNLSQVNAGADTVSIRGLGAQRNLVLFDHQRVVSANVQDGTVDIALIPSGLTQRIDVVTGGASAAWGSDAVTGVVNIVLNKTFEGFKGSVTYSDSTEISDPVYRASLAWGTAFLGGKGHTVAAADFTINNTAVFPGDSARNHPNYGRGFVYNSAYCNSIVYPVNNGVTATSGGKCAAVNAGQPLVVYAYGLGNTQSVVGGLVTGNTGGVAGAPVRSNGLKGTMFVGPDGTPSQFNYGTLYGSSTCYNGCTNNQFGTGGWGGPNNPYHSATYFSYTSYQPTPDIKASVQLNYARLTLRSHGNVVGGTGRRIYADNPYLPDSIAQSFVCAGGTPGDATCNSNLSNGYNPYTHQYDVGPAGSSFDTVGERQARPGQSITAGFEFSGNRPNPSPSSTTSVEAVDYNMDDFCNTIYQNCGWYNKALMRGVFTLEGSLSDNWVWNAYIEASQARVKENVQNVISNRVTNALDAVRITSGNVGTSGLPIGSIQCRGLLNPALATQSNATQISYGYTAAEEIQGCVPFNPFGDGQASVATMNYVKPSLNYRATGELDVNLVRMSQVEGSASMQGVLPWQLPAGEVGVSFGAEWRLEQSGQFIMDNRSNAAMYPSGNFGNNMFAHLHSEEGFLELAAPLLKNDIVQSLDLDIAGRMTNYSFSGLVETWKIGLTSQVNDDFKLRATWSYDIRAPDNWDLFGPGAIGQNSCASFIIGPTGTNGGNPNSCFNVSGGNPNLVPEKANSLTAGIVMTPHWIDGLTASVDWYQIHLHGALYTPSLGTTISRCQQGETVYCPQIIFNRQGSFALAQGCGGAGLAAACPGGDTTSQIEWVHISPVNANQLNTAGFDFAVAYGFDLFTGSMDASFNGNYVYDYSQLLNGVYFQGAGGGGYYGGGAKFQGTVNLNYREGAWSFGAQVRMTGESVMDLGTEGQPAINCEGLQSFTQVSQNGVTQNVATLSRGQRCSAETNYNAMTAPVDLRLQYRWNNNITLFANVDNVQDLPTAGGILRRSYRLGVRWNY